MARGPILGGPCLFGTGERFVPSLRLSELDAPASSTGLVSALHSPAYRASRATECGAFHGTDDFGQVYQTEDHQSRDADLGCRDERGAPTLACSLA